MLAGLSRPALARDDQSELRVGALTRTYAIHVPQRSAPKGGYPILFAFHGGGGEGAKIATLMKFDPYADARGFIVVYPDGLDRHWNDGRDSIKNKSDDIGFVTALLDDLKRRYPVNANKVFAVGISNGAVFSQRVACELSDRFTAIAAVSGSLAADLAPSCHPARPISVLQIAGTADPIMPYDGGAVRKILGMGEGGNVLSVRDTVVLWAEKDGCAAPSEPERLALITQPDGTAVTKQSYAQCQGSATVTLLSIEGGGHAWPGGPQIFPRIVGRASQQLDATRAIIDFFFPTQNSN
jgi:polyhydroxybutyrate depolymerase